MKKFLFPFFALFIFFVGVKSIFAYSTSPDSSYNGSLDFTSIYNNSYFTSQEFTDYYTDFKSWFNSQNTYNYYYFFFDYHNGNVNQPRAIIMLFETLQEANKIVYNLRQYLNDNVYYNVLTNDPPSTYSSIVDSFSNGFSTQYLYSNQHCSGSNICFMTTYNPSNMSSNVIIPSYNPLLFIDSNNPLNYIVYTISRGYQFKLDNLYYSSGETIPSLMSYSFPHISVSTQSLYDSSDNLVGYDAYVNWGNKNLSNYIYRYKSSDSDWVELTTTSPRDIIHIYNNGSYSFQILDRSDGSIVDSYSLNITSIYEGVPTINYKFSYMCETNYMGTIYHPCISYNLDVDNFTSFMRLEYSSDGNYWIPIDDTLHSVSFYSNGTYVVRVRNSLNNNVLSSVSISVSDITIPNTTSPYITYNVSCDETIDMLVYYNVFNVQSDYSYQYLTSLSSSFSYINNVDYDSSSHIASFYIRSIVDTNNIVVRVIDDLNNIVVSSSVDFQNLICVNGNIIESNVVSDEISDTNSFINGGYSSFIARCFRVIYDNIPPLVLEYFIKFLILFCLGTFLVVIGWK